MPSTPLTSLSDQALVSQSLGGCLDSFSELVARHQTPLLRFLRHRTQTREDAEDLTQDAFVRAFEKLDRYRPDWSFATWLFALARRISINHYRRCARSAIARPGIQRADECADPGGDPASALAEREGRLQLWRLAAKVLSERQWSSLWLFYAEDQSLLEISRVVNCTPSAVKALLHRGRGKLAVALVAQQSPSVPPRASGHAALHNLFPSRRGWDQGLEAGNEKKQ